MLQNNDYSGPEGSKSIFRDLMDKSMETAPDFDEMIAKGPGALAELEKEKEKKNEQSKQSTTPGTTEATSESIQEDEGKTISSESTSRSSTDGESTDTEAGDSNEQPAPTSDLKDIKPSDLIKDAAKTEETIKPQVEDVDPELDGLDLPKTTSTKTADVVKKFKTVAKERLVKLTALEKAQKDFEAKINQLEEQVKSAPAPMSEEDKLEFQRLKKLEIGIQRDASPEIQTKYYNKIKDSDDKIWEILKTEGLSEENEKYLKSFGGKFSDISDEARENLEKYLGSKTKNMISLREQEIMRLEEDKDKEIKDAINEATNYKDKIIQSETIKKQEYYTKAKSKLDSVIDTIPWAKLQEVPAGATAEKKAEIEAHNKYLDGLYEFADKAIKAETPEDRAELAIAAALAHKYHKDFNSVLKLYEDTKSDLEGKLNAALAEAKKYKSEVEAIDKLNRMDTSAEKKQVKKEEPKNPDYVPGKTLRQIMDEV